MLFTANLRKNGVKAGQRFETENATSNIVQERVKTSKKVINAFLREHLAIQLGIGGILPNRLSKEI